MSPCVTRFRKSLKRIGLFGFLLNRGGDEQNRTVDPLLARQVLSQLSYTPIFSRGTSVPPLQDKGPEN